MTRRLGVIAALVAALGLVAAAPAMATQAATQQQIDGIVAATNAYTTPLGYTFNGYLVQDIRVSSVDPAYAAAQIVPNSRYRGPLPAPQMLLTGSGSTWRVIDSGLNFCDAPGVPSAVIKDLFNETCRGGNPNANKDVIAQSSGGGLRLQLIAQRGSGNTATVFLAMWRPVGGQLKLVTERRLGTKGGFVWQSVTGVGGGYLTWNPNLGYASAQVLRSPTAYYVFYPFRVGLGFTPLPR